MSMPSPNSAHRMSVFDARRGAIALAFLLARLKPHRLAVVLRFLSRGARPAHLDAATTLHELIVSTSPKCAGWRGCLPRSIAIAMLCRCRGTWPTWCAGVRRTPPFAAHAWVECQSQVVGECLPPSAYAPLIRIEAPVGGRTQP